MIEPYLGAAGVLTGSARVAQEARDQAEAQRRRETVERQRAQLQRKRALAERQIAELRAEIEAEEAEVARLIAQEEGQETLREESRSAIAVSRGVKPNGEDAARRPKSRRRSDTAEHMRTR
jgi:circadian clock protein KaiC